MHQTSEKFLLTASVVIMLCLNPPIILAQQKNSKKPVDKTMPGKQLTKIQTSTSTTKDEPALKDVYKDAFLIGVAVNPSITSGADKVSQDIVIANRYAELFLIFYKKRDKISRVTLWGVHDGMSWKNDYPIPGRINYPSLWDRQRKPKPVLKAVLSAPSKSGNQLN